MNAATNGVTLQAEKMLQKQAVHRAHMLEGVSCSIRKFPHAVRDASLVACVSSLGAELFWLEFVQSILQCAPFDVERKQE